MDENIPEQFLVFWDALHNQINIYIQMLSLSFTYRSGNISLGCLSIWLISKDLDVKNIFNKAVFSQDFYFLKNFKNKYSQPSIYEQVRNQRLFLFGKQNTFLKSFVTCVATAS